MNTLEKFGEYMRSNGLEPPAAIFADGRIHRFKVSGDNSGSKNGWYVLHDDKDLAAGSFGCWKRDIKVTWCSKANQVMTTKDKKTFAAKMDKIKRKYDAEQTCLHAECREKAEYIWNGASKKNTAKNSYTIRKKIKPYTAKTTKKGDLIIPVYDVNAELQGLQFIKPDGEKKFLPGTKKQGNFSYLGKSHEEVKTICICEGWATGCTICEATSLPVVVAFDAGNLKLIAENWRRKLPKHKIIIAGDDDHATDKNPGRTKANEAANAVNGIAVFPNFKNSKGKTDFNDMHQEQGLDSVKSIFRKARKENNWPEPIFFGNHETPEIPFSVLPKKLSDYCKAVADSTQTPSGLAVMTGLAVVATCLQKRFEVAPYGDNYREPVNIMSVVAIEPASRKTAVKNALTEPLTEWEKEQADILKEEADRVRHERDMLIKSIDSLKGSMSKPDTTKEDRIEALLKIKQLEESMPKEINMPQLWTDDVTPERLQALMAENGERFAIISDEGGIFEVISGLYTGGKSNINVFLQSHAGSSVRVERQGRSVKMHKPALTFGLTVQPAIISDLASGSKSRFRGNGMLARLLFCIPKSTVGTRDVTKRSSIPESIRIEYHALIKRLLSIKPKLDETGNELPRILTLAPDAIKIWQKFSQDIESKQGKFGEFHSIQDWTGKLPGAALRIAGLCHVVEHGKRDTVIGKVTVKKAITLAQLLIAHTKVAFGMMGSDPSISDAKVALEWIFRNNANKFRRGDIHKALHGRFQRVERLKSALKVLIERHFISEPQEQYTGRRPEIVYTVNPLTFKNSVE